MFSSGREARGIIVNQAICFALPFITSDKTGASGDLVQDGENGFIYRSGRVSALAELVQQIVDLTEEELKGNTIYVRAVNRNVG